MYYCKTDDPSPWWIITTMSVYASLWITTIIMNTHAWLHKNSPFLCHISPAQLDTRVKNYSLWCSCWPLLKYLKIGLISFVKWRKFKINVTHPSTSVNIIVYSSLCSEVPHMTTSATRIDSVVLVIFDCASLDKQSWIHRRRIPCILKLLQAFNESAA